MLLSFEGWQFRLEIIDRTEEVEPLAPSAACRCSNQPSHFAASSNLMKLRLGLCAVRTVVR